jgi:DNA gyrase/topoisomerase IV subunit B
LITLESVKYSQALLKIIDESISNCVDHYIKFPRLVKVIKISFDKKTGFVEIFNDGPGIPVTKVDTINNGKKYQPCAILSEFLAGDNFTEGENRI